MRALSSLNPQEKLMRILSTRVHGFMDYGMGLLLLLSPYLFGFATGGPKQWLPMILGAGAILYSLMTRYELGAIKVIPMSAHLGLDMLSGTLLAASPWLFGFADQVFWPHLVLGLIEIGTAAMTQTASSVDGLHLRRHHART
jgi:SPW repeat